MMPASPDQTLDPIVGNGGNQLSSNQYTCMIYSIIFLGKGYFYLMLFNTYT
jgi:hypothetical protein